MYSRWQPYIYLWINSTLPEMMLSAHSEAGTQSLKRFDLTLALRAWQAVKFSKQLRVGPAFLFFPEAHWSIETCDFSFCCFHNTLKSVFPSLLHDLPQSIVHQKCYFHPRVAQRALRQVAREATYHSGSHTATDEK